MKMPGLTEPLDRRNLVAVKQHSEGEAGIYAPAIDMHRASPALAVVAPFLRAGEAEFLAQTIEQGGAGIELQVAFLSVHAERDGNGPFDFRRFCGGNFRFFRVLICGSRKWRNGR